MSMNRQFLFGLLAGVVVVGLLLFSVWMATGRPVIQPQRDSVFAKHHPAVTHIVAGDHERKSIPNDRQEKDMTPPWMSKGASSSVPVRSSRPENLNLPVITAGNVNVAAVSAQLDAMIKRHGGQTVIQGVDFAILKKNLEKVQELQNLAQEAQELTKQKKPDAQKVNALLARMSTIQSEIRSNLQDSHLLSLVHSQKQ